MSPRSILICEDERELAAEIAEFLEAEHWRPTLCASVSQAHALLVQGLAPDCLLTDLRLGEMSGLDLIARTRRLPKPLRPRVLALITGEATDVALGEPFGPDVLFFKPVDPFEMLADLEARFVDCKIIRWPLATVRRNAASR
ncbi:response regulator [Afifella sp. H1R]|uniref:response regulator n=1 Tax=unclassified Afifella TaxID=2624128 RepID=UPI001F464C69|nr:response regulator [Afifella sp. H1R]MCF1503774.1 response regulator [Afifella sp. H1R]